MKQNAPAFAPVTSIVANSRKIQGGNDSDVLTAAEIAQTRERAAAAGIDVASMSDEDIQTFVAQTCGLTKHAVARLLASLICNGVNSRCVPTGHPELTAAMCTLAPQW